MIGRAALAMMIMVIGLVGPSPAGADDHPAVVVVPRGTSSTVDVTLRALARLHQYGYTISTPARADRAIRHWQRVNGLTVDGIIGPETLASLGVAGATASVPAARSLPPVPAADPEAIIREIWPDELEDRAVQIATRESRLQPSARNACCLGLFQVHWRAHRGWLTDLGITSPDQLLDARTNSIAALALYERSGWAPWSL